MYLEVRYYLITLDNTVISNKKYTLKEYIFFELIYYLHDIVL